MIGWVEQLDQSRIPLYSQLLLHKEKQSISLHVPGHKNGVFFPIETVASFSDVLKLDVTELSNLDDLHSPEGVILESELLLAGLYGVQKSFFLVNGSTVGNLAMILSVIAEDEQVLVQRNCHKSILNGLQLAKANPIFLSPEYDDDWQVAAGVSFEMVKVAIGLYPNIKAIILTYPNYYGMVYDLKKIIQLAHKHRIPVLVDEAHGAHFIAGNPFPDSAVTLGADVVVQSAHKTLPAMTMGSFLHINSELVSEIEIKKNLQMLQSSSPSYPIMASLDIARSYLGTFSKSDKQILYEKVQNFRQSLAELTGIRVLPYMNDQGDLLKLTIQSTSLLSGFELQKRLEQVGIYSEMADAVNVLLVLPLLKKEHSYSFFEITSRIKSALVGVDSCVNRSKTVHYQKNKLTKLELSFIEIQKRSTKKVELKEAIGKIAGEMITPYPPGIPLLFPGEIISREDIKQINELIHNGAKFQGGEALKEGMIAIF
jgi:arginine/lysine/ornithine decarboxylase